MINFCKTIFIVVLVTIITNTANAQQDPMYSQYMFNALAINPAYAGSRNVISATALHRNQWVGIDGAPKTTTITVDAPTANQKIGLGVQVYHDKIGITNSTGLVLSSAYRIRMDRATLSFGLQGSLENFNANFNNVRLDQNGSSTDPAFMNDIRTAQFNFGSGVYYNSDKFYFGIGVPKILPNKLNSNSSTSISIQKMHFFASAGFLYSMAADEFKLRPSLLLKAVEGAPLEADINLTLWIKDAIGIGGQIRTNADVSGSLQIQATQQIRLGYSYDYSTTKLRRFNSGSHEIMLRYEFGFQKDKVISPRYF